MHRSDNLRRLCLAVAIAFLAVVASPAFAAEDAKQVFDSLFAGKIKAVTATIDRADDLALAKDMLALAKTSTNQPALLALLCDAVHDLSAKHADGYATGVEAQQLLADTVAEKRSAARDKLVALLTRQTTAGKPDERDPAGEKLIDLLTTMGDEKAEKKQYAEAIGDYRRAVAVATQKKSASLDEVKAKLDWASGRDRTMKRLAQLQEKLLKDATDHATAEEIVKLYVVELDDPASAVPFLHRVKDEQLKKMVPLAASDRTQLAETDALNLAEFYRGLIGATTGPSKGTMIDRAIECLERFIAQHTTADLQLTKANSYLKEAKEERKKLIVASVRVTRGRQVDVLAMIDTRRDAAEGSNFSKKNGVLSIDASAAWHGMFLPHVPKGDYELRIQFTKSESGNFEVYLKRDGRRGGYALLGSGLEAMELDKSRELTKVPNAYRAPAPSKPHLLRACVNATSIVIHLDDQKIIEHAIDFPSKAKDAKPHIVIGMYRGTVSIDKISISE